jgi:hypothetical protein
MGKVYFMNNGEFDVESMLTFGVSVKEDDAIGYFGTGFKYAIGIVLRLGGSMKVETMGKEFVFTVDAREVRGKSFDFVQCNGSDAGFTTHLGANWSPWQAFRELYCNAADEGGIASDKHLEFDTVITVDCDEIYQAYLDRDKYFLVTEPLLSTSSADVHERAGNFHYFKRVAVANSDHGHYSYNVRSTVRLSEDRCASAVANDILAPISKALANCEDREILRNILTSGAPADKDRYFSKYAGASDVFVTMCRELMASDIAIPESARNLIKHMDEKDGDWPLLELTLVQSTMLTKSLSFLKSINIPANDFEIKVVKGLGDGIMGRALSGVIYLSAIPFELGTKQLAGTIMEEWVHLKYKHEDFDRGMQNWLFDKVISMGEEANGEPI